MPFSCCRTSNLMSHRPYGLVGGRVSVYTVEGLLPLHPEAFRILIILRAGERHGYALVKELERDPGRPGRLLPANLYRRIRTLQEQGLIEEADHRPDPDLDDERRRYFRITDFGAATARAEAHRLDALLAGARDLLSG